MKSNDNLNANQIVLWMIWGALICALFVYVTVLLMNGGELRESASLQDPMVVALACVSVVVLVIGFAVRKFFTVPAAKRFKDNPEYFGNVMTGSIISWALSESVAIFGLFLGFSGYPFSQFSIFLLVSFIALVLHAPTYLRS